VTISATTGFCNYLGYFLGIGIPREWLHRIALIHICAGWALVVYLIGHGAMAVHHWRVERRARGARLADDAQSSD
jgi:hypothetical protein